MYMTKYPKVYRVKKMNFFDEITKNMSSTEMQI